MKLIESVSFNNTGLTKHLGYDTTTAREWHAVFVVNSVESDTQLENEEGIDRESDE